MEKPNVAVEVFLSLVKWFLVILLLNNLIWGAIFYSAINGDTIQASQEQSGTNNYQAVNDVSKARN
jgi:hypothetical protein